MARTRSSSEWAATLEKYCALPKDRSRARFQEPAQGVGCLIPPGSRKAKRFDERGARSPARLVGNTTVLRRHCVSLSLLTLLDARSSVVKLSFPQAVL